MTQEPRSLGAYMKQRRAAAKAEGNCQLCMKREAMPGQSRCGACADQQDAYKARRKEARS